MVDDLPVFPFESARTWDRWLTEHGESSRGVWLELAKRNSGHVSVTYEEALEVALRHGWIDSQKRSSGEGFWLQRFTPRGARSLWSRRNRERATALIQAGRMKPSGLRQVELAKADGRWEAAYDSQGTATVPDDLQAQLDRRPAAATFFSTLDSRNRYAILFQIQTAKRPETRARRIEKYVAMLAARQRLYP